MSTPSGKRDHFYNTVTVTNTSFNYLPTVAGQGADVFWNVKGGVNQVLLNITTSNGNGIIDYSFNGITTSGQLIAGTPRAALALDKHASSIWFKCTTQNIVIVEAWQ